MSHSVPRILRISDVQERLGGVSRSTVYRWMNEGWFPKPMHFGKNSIGWLEDDVSSWLLEMRNGVTA